MNRQPVVKVGGGGILRACCGDPRKRKVLEDESHMRVEQCQDCGRKHYTAFVGQRLKPGVVKIA